MAELKNDLRLVRGALGWLVALGTLAVLMYAASSYFRSEMREAFAAEQSRFRAISQRYLSVDEEERIVREQFPTFRALYRDGVIGDERRLDWLEGVRVASERLDLPHLELRMESQRAGEPGFSVAPGQFELRASTMRLKLGLVHEGDLVGFLEAVDAGTPGHHSITRCSLRRLVPDFVANGASRNLDAECELTWFTLDLSGGRRVSL